MLNKGHNKGMSNATAKQVKFAESLVRDIERLRLDRGHNLDQYAAHNASWNQVTGIIADLGATFPTNYVRAEKREAWLKRMTVSEVSAIIDRLQGLVTEEEALRAGEQSTPAVLLGVATDEQLLAEVARRGLVAKAPV